MTTHIHAFTIVVPDYDAGLAFYAGVMGFTVTSDHELGGGKRWILVQPPGGGAQVLLAKASGGEQDAAIGNQTGGRVGFFLYSDNFDSDYRAMVTAGVTFEEEPRTETYGKVAVWSDPFGNRWDLLQLF